MRSTDRHHKPFIRVRNRSGSEDVHYSLLYEGLPEEFKIIAEKELKETEDGRKQGLQKLKEYMRSQNMPYLKDELLLAILRNCKYDMKKSEAKLKNFVNSRREIIRMLDELGMKKVEHLIDDMPFGILPYRDKHGRVILYTRPNGIRLDRYEVNDVGLLMAVGGLFVLSYPITSVAGFVYYGECKAPSMYMYYSIFKAFKKYMFYMFSLPIRVSRAEILNENYICRCFHKLVSPLIGKKIMDRVSLHGSSFDRFHQMYDPEILPEDFGGNMGPLSSDVYRQELLDFIRNLIKENNS